MARPLRGGGIEYFPLDCGFLRDDKVRLLTAEFGDRCIKTIIALFCRIYSGAGYYMAYSDDDCLLLSTGDLSGQDAEYINEVVNGCVRRSLFDKRVFDMFGILTSSAIQRRYVTALAKRSKIVMNADYLLLDLQEEDGIPISILQKIVVKSGFSDENAPQTEPSEAVTGTFGTQSKSKRERESKSESRESAKAPKQHFVPPTFDEVTAYCKERNNSIDPQLFIDFYSTRNWYVGNHRMVDWKACVRTWEQRDNNRSTPKKTAALQSAYMCSKDEANEYEEYIKRVASHPLKYAKKEDKT